MSLDVVKPQQIVDLRGLVAIVRRAASITVTVVIPIVLTIHSVLWIRHSFAPDFKGDLYGAARAILHGHSPYRPDYISLQAALKRAGGIPNTWFALPVYPPPILLAAVPFGLLPFFPAAVLFVALSTAATILALRLLGVRDWRCNLVAFAALPVTSGIYTGTLTPLLMLGVAVAWRWRNRLWAPAAAVASIVAAKLFLWPIGLWLLITKRFRAAATALALAGLGIVIAWAVIGFAGISAYPRMVANDSLIFEGAGVSLVAALLSAGLPVAVARVVALAVAVVLLGVGWRLAGRPDGDRRAFGLAVMAALAGFPIVWWHYLTFVFVPIALMSPALSAVWYVPLLAYLAPAAHTDGDLLKMLPYFAIEAIVIAHLCCSDGPGEESARGAISGLDTKATADPRDADRWTRRPTRVDCGKLRIKLPGTSAETVRVQRSVPLGCRARQKRL